MKLIRTTMVFCLALALPPVWAETITLHIGKLRIHAEVARTPQSRERGLMQRGQLCADCGMLFIFKKADRLRFWMKDTPLPLSIAFIAADGTILNIADMQPNTTDTHSALGDALYALEMNSGWFTQHGVQPGNKIRPLKRLRDTP